MAQNLQIDPTKKDYVVVNGSPIPTDRILEATYYAILIPKGRWVYGDPDQGSLLYTLQNTKRSGSIEQNFASYTNDAIRNQLIATGKATASEVKNLAATSTGTSNQINVVPNETQLSDQIDFVSV